MMDIATEYIQHLPLGSLEILLIAGTFAALVIGKIGLYLINRYL